MAKKRTTLPKEFPEILASGDLAAMKAVFERCEIDARGGYLKETALAHVECPDDLARWLVTQGADLEAPDRYGRTPLHARAGHWQGEVAVLIELGAQIDRPEGTETPLHAAARVQNVAAARLLLDHGARWNARDKAGLTPLGAALSRCNNASLAAMAPMAELLLTAGASAPKPGLLARLTGKAPRSEADDPTLKAMVRKLGENFEFHRADFNPDTVDEASAGLERLYELFSVSPAPRRNLHPVDEPIRAKSARWQDAHNELWQALVPGKGAAPTVQGEVIRIAGRVADELDRNGGVNWDDGYREMVDALVVHLGSGTPLHDAALATARQAASEIKRKRGDPVILMELAVQWVALNPQPVILPKPDYDR